MKKIVFTIAILLCVFLASCSKKDNGGDTPSHTTDNFGEIEINENSDYNKLFTDNAVKEGISFVNQLLFIDYKVDKTAFYSKDEFQEIYQKNIPLPKGNVTIEDWTANSPELFQKNPALRNKVVDLFNKKVDAIITLRKNLITKEQEAKQGVLGYISAVDEQGALIGKKRFVDEKGIELSEVLKKQEMGIILLDQIINHHLSDDIMNDGNLRKANKERTFMNNKKYTELEYHWDIAYALLGTENKDKIYKFLANYLIKEHQGSNDKLQEKVYSAFKLGRKALTKSDYVTVQKSIQTIRESLSKLFATRAIYYLQQAKVNIDSSDKRNKTEAIHNLSETYGFIASFIVTRKANGGFYINDYKVVEDLLRDFEGTNGFWEKDRLLAGENTKGSIENVIKRIKEIYSIN